jgi:2-polyprenyl-3-methyl-5-hydroxy-6-metoxy-1,4-benzoquinol methylase
VGLGPAQARAPSCVVVWLAQMTSSANAVPETKDPMCPQCKRPGHWAYRGVRDAWHLDDQEYNFARCDGCRSLFVVPAPTDEELLKSYAYASYYTHAGTEATGRRSPIHRFLHRINLDTFREAFGYGSGSFLASTLAKFGWVKRRCGQSMRFLRWKQNGTLLDVGCGDGAFLREARGWGWKCWGLEPDQQAQCHHLPDEAGIQVLCGGIEDLERHGLRFDAIVLNHVIEHLRDPSEALRVLRNVLAPGGRIVSISPNPEALGLRLAGKRWPGLDPPRHLLIPSRGLLLRICDQWGLTVDCFSLHRNLRSSCSVRMRQSAERREIGWLAGAGFKVVAALGAVLEIAGTRCGDEIVLVATRP